MSSKHTLEFTDANFDEDVLRSDQPVLVDFWAAWCGPCKALGPTINEIAEQYGGQVKVGKVNVDDNPATAAAYEIRSIPTVLLFRDGRVVEKFVGVQPKARYEQALNAVAV